MKIRFPLWITLLVCVVFFSIFAILLTPDKPKGYPPYITTSPSPTGVKAFYTYIKTETKIPTHIWSEPISRLTGQAPRQLMVMVQPSKPFTEKERLEWKQWMKKGNTLLLFVSDPKDFFDLKVEYGNKTFDEGTEVFGKGELSGTYHTKVLTSARLATENKDHILLKDDQGILSLEEPYGNGKLVVFLTPDWLTNDNILDGDGLEPVLKLFNSIDPNGIWFNDYIHNAGEEAHLLELYPSWLVIILAQAALILLLFLWYRGRRFGPIDLPRQDTVRTNDERLRATAAWFGRGHLYMDSLLFQEAYLRQKIEDRFRISARLNDEALLDHLRNHYPGLSYTNWEQAFREWKKVKENASLSKKGFVKWAKTFHNMLKEVEKS